MACEVSRDDSSSDDDSVSLLCSLDARQTRGAAEDMGGVDATDCSNASSKSGGTHVKFLKTQITDFI